MYKTNRFHLAVRELSNNAKMTSNRGKNISYATPLRFVTYCFVCSMYTHSQMESIC